MKRAVLAMMLLGGIGRVASADAKSDLQARLWSALAAGSDCAKDSHTKFWCDAATGWSAAKAAPLPKSKLLVGVTVTLTDQGVVTTELRDHTALSAVALELAGEDKHPTIAIHPIAFTEQVTNAKAIGRVTMVLLGKSKVAEVPGGPDMARGAVASIKPEDLVEGGHGWTWSGGELRKVGALWVAIQPTPDGAYVTILTDKAK